MAVFDAFAAGLSPDVGTFVGRELREIAERLGYQVVSEDAARAAVQATRIAGALSPEQAVAATRNARADRGVFATIAVAPGGYSIVLHVTGSDGSGPFVAQGTASPTELAGALDRLLRSVLPPIPPPPERVAAPEDFLPWRFAVQTEAVFGLSPGKFYNHLVGGRLERRFSKRVSLGAYVGYINLKGKSGRAHNALPLVQLEYRAPFNDSLSMPLRFGQGYLPKNGPVMRLSAGLAYAFSESVDVTVDLLVPTLWLTHDETVFSLDAAAELGVSF